MNSIPESAAGPWTTKRLCVGVLILCGLLGSVGPSSAEPGSPGRQDTKPTVEPPPVPFGPRWTRYSLFGDVLEYKHGSAFLRRESYVRIDGDRIGSITSERPDGQVVAVNGLILPGLINLHDHISWDAHPRFDKTNFTTPPPYSNRYAWQKDGLYDEFSRTHYGLVTSATKYLFDGFGELRQLVGGTTCVADGVSVPADAPKWRDALIRNAWSDFLYPYISKKIGYEVFFLDKTVLSANPPVVQILQKALDSIRDNDLCLIHLCEGKRGDALTRMEFDAFHGWAVVNPTLASRVVVIHGNGLEVADFRKLVRLGINRLVWSPYSNMRLYNETLDVAAVLDEGMTVALGTDWYPSGTDSLFDEFRVAREVAARCARPLTERELVSMLVLNPALILGAPDKLGGIAPGAVADLTVIPWVGKSVVDSLLAADTDNLLLVVVGGVPLYGTQALMTAMSKDVVESSVPGRTWAFGFDWRPLRKQVTGLFGPKQLPVAPVEALGDPGK